MASTANTAGTTAGTGRKRRFRADFSLAIAKMLNDLRPGTLFTSEGAAIAAAIASESCGGQHAALYRLALADRTIVRLDVQEESHGMPVSAALLEKAARLPGPTSRHGLLIARLWPWERGDTAATAVLIVLQAAPSLAQEGLAPFTPVDHRRLGAFASILALREARYEQRQAADLLRRGLHAMAARPEADVLLNDLADALAEASGAAHVAIWLTSAENADSLQLRALQGQPDLTHGAQGTMVGESARMDLLRLARGGPVLVSLRAVPWLPDALGLDPASLGDLVVVVPVRREGAMIGAVTGMQTAGTSDTLADLSQASRASLLEALADQVALTSTFARTAREAQQRARRATFLAALAEIGLVKMGAAEMVDAILARVRDHFAAHRASLYLLQRANGNLGARSVQREEPADGKLFAARASVAAEQRLLGSLVVRRGGRPFDQAEEQTLAEAAKQIALALSTSERYEFQAAMAVLDMLTDLPNRRSAEAKLDNELGRMGQADGSLLGVALLDIDHFKIVNDTYGHATGDRVLSEIAGIFKAQLRSTDYIARWGGEEFLLLYRCDDIERLHQIGERVRRAASDMMPKTTDGQAISVSVSLGGAVSPLNGHARDDLIGLADTALYEAKRLGRNCSAWAGLPT